MTQYLFRLDDICPTMRWSRFEELVHLFDAYQIKPLLAVVPHNLDRKLCVDDARSDFWSRLRSLRECGWLIAQHGYQHLYHTAEGGLLGLRARSEFAGLTYAQQKEKIQHGQAILQEHLERPVTWWSAPAHSFDITTCQVLRDLGFTHISDGIALSPFTYAGLTWIPHQTWSPRGKPCGFWTIGLHLNTMSDSAVVTLKNFLLRHDAACRKLDLQPRLDRRTPVFRRLWYIQFKASKVLAH